MAVLLESLYRHIWPLANRREASRYAQNPEVQTCCECNDHRITHVRLAPNAESAVNRFAGFLCDACAQRDSKGRRNRMLRIQREVARGSVRNCKVCESEYTPKRSDSLYCSAACRQKAHRRHLSSSQKAVIKSHGAT